MVAVITLLSKEGDRRERYEIVPAEKAEAAADAFYASGDWYVEVSEPMSRDAALATIAASL